MTDAYARTQQAWYEANEAHADALRRIISDREVVLAQADRRRTRDAIADGLWCRSLFTATGS